LPAGESDLTREAALLLKIVRDAGALALRMRGGDLKTWTKGASSPVSDADIAVNDLIEKRLRTATPEYGWLSEETEDNDARITLSRTWIVDPIDGTRAYLARQDDWSVSVALVENHSPVLAAVFAPMRNGYFFAVRGQGATLNGSPIKATSGTGIDFSRIAGPKPLISRLPAKQTDAVTHPRVGSLALRLCLVADATLDAAFATGNSCDWDLAAADLIVHEAGGEMTNLDGTPLVYNQVDVRHGYLLAAGRERHDFFVKHFRRHPLS
jgi:myo-inositol-1(or 4)-monophosphatase